MEEIIAMFPTVGAIVIICFVVAQLLKNTDMPTKWLPVVTAVLGGVLGVVGRQIGIADFDAVNIFDAIAMGICSGLASNGAYSFYKNVSGGYEDNDLPKADQKLFFGRTKY